MQDFHNILNIIYNSNYTIDNIKKIIDFFKIHGNKKDIINKISHIKDFTIYIKLIHIIENDIDVSNIEKKRLLYIKNNINNNYSSFKYLKDEIIYYFFRDSYYNFLINYHNMLLYMKRIGEYLIPIEHINFYNECYRLSEITKEKQIEFFRKYSDKNTCDMFYDDMRKVKNHSYHNLVNNTLKLNKNGTLYNAMLSEKYGVDVYFLNGEEFNIFVRYFEFGNNLYNIDDLYCNLSKKYYSFSYIGDKNIGTICKFDFNGILLMYSSINPNYITHVHHTDSGSSIFSKKEFFVSNKINEIHTAKSILNDTRYYNEIVIKKGDDGIIPTSIVCFDNIKEKDIIISHKYKLPIILINSKKYYYDNGYPDFNDNDTYYL